MHQTSTKILFIAILQVKRMVHGVADLVGDRFLVNPNKRLMTMTRKNKMWRRNLRTLRKLKKSNNPTKMGRRRRSSNPIKTAAQTIDIRREREDQPDAMTQIKAIKLHRHRNVNDNYNNNSMMMRPPHLLDGHNEVPPNEIDL